MNAERLGYIAAIPFVVLAALVVFGAEAAAPALRALVAYAAVVASFIGAIHWGFGFVQPVPRARLLLWGVTPAIVAWPTLLVAPPTGLAIDAVLLAACYLVDRSVYSQQGVARWLPLRLRLTLIAVTSCAVAVVAALAAR